MNEGLLTCVALFAVACTVTGCGAKANDDLSNTAAGGSHSDGGFAGGTAAGQSSRLCPIAEPIAAPPVADGCTVAAAELDAGTVCELDGCPITKVLDVDCQTTLAEPRITASADSAWVMVQTPDAPASAQLVTVTTSESRVQPLAAPLPSEALAADMSGSLLLFDGDTSGISALRASLSTWQSMRLPLDSPQKPVSVTSAELLDSTVGYFTFLLNGIEPHLATWDGTCWADAKLADGANEQLVVKVDLHGSPSVAWEAIETEGFVIGTRSIGVRNPQPGMPDESIDLPRPPYGAWEYDSPRLRLLPGGLDGSAAFPTVALKLWDGISLFTYDTSVDSHWVTQILPASEPAAATGNCPEVEDYGLGCRGLTSCSEQVKGTGTDFDVVRTQAGGWYAAWLEYVSEATYDIQRLDIGGEMGISYCLRSEVSGAGTTDLVIAHLAGAEPVLNRFRLYTGDVQSTTDGIAMAARGDTLLIATILNRRGTPILRYLEIDATRLQ